ncbi:unnamed protein product, partial [Chrysoparadoxa australica]
RPQRAKTCSSIPLADQFLQLTYPFCLYPPLGMFGYGSGTTMLLAALLPRLSSSFAFSPCAVRLVGVAQSRHLCMAGDSSGSSSPVTPDFTTTVDVTNHKLPKAKKPEPLTRTPKWVGLEGLEERTTGSLIPETLVEMETDKDFQLTAAKLKEMGQKKLTLEERKIRRRALQDLGLPQFHQFIEQRGLTIPRAESTILQINIGLYCNQACAHCHVESSPQRKETMSREVVDQCINVLKASPSITTLDITGGAPELNEQFRYLVTRAREESDVEIIDRCNLTVLMEPGQEDLCDFLAKNKVRVVASLPCYSPKNVNQQRGNGVFDRSIQALSKLNDAGYGVEGSGLTLDLVYNPLGAFLPPPQEALQEKYKEELFAVFGLVFNDLFTITNMPIKRFADFLHRRGELQEYMELLVRNFNDGATKGVMCKDTINVGWDGMLYDCDFNQQLKMGMGTMGTTRKAPENLQSKSGTGYSIFDIEDVQELYSTEIALESHCFGCTAGMGSSCQGATA